MYESYFRLRELPFNVTPDPRFLYINSNYRAAFATLCYGVQQRKGITVLTGQAGTGKTTLVKMFLQDAGSTVHLSCVLDPHLSFLELLRCTLSAFELSPSGATRLAMIQQLKEYLLEQLTHDHIVALLLDEAQDVDNQVLEEVRLLSDLEHAGTRLLQLVLIGQPELELRLDQRSLYHLRQRIALRARLAPLGTDEIQSYINFRLAAAGYSGATIFQNAAVHRIAFFSHGIPRLINVICDNALLIASATNQDEIGAETIDEVAEDLQLGEHDANRWTFVPAAEPSFDIPDSVVVPAPRFDVAEAAQEEIREREVVIAHHVKAPGDCPAPNYAPVVQNPVVPSSASDFIQNQRVVGSLALAVLIVILGGLALLVSRPQSQDYFAPVTEKIEQIQEAVAPIQARIYRVLTARSLWETPFRGLARDDGPYSDTESGDEVPRFTAKPLDRDEEGKFVTPDRQPGRADRTRPPALADDVRSTTISRRGVVESPKRSSPASNYSVVGNSYVRDKPTSQADIIATLRPGTRIQVVGRSGEYFQIRSLNTESISGYVHKEDAFFEPPG